MFSLFNINHYHGDVTTDNRQINTTNSVKGIGTRLDLSKSTNHNIKGKGNTLTSKTFDLSEEKDMKKYLESN